MQVSELRLAEAGVESGALMYRTVKDMRGRLTGDSSSRQRLESHKPRLGAHVSCCDNFGKPGFGHNCPFLHAPAP